MYVYFLRYLERKDPTEMNGVESYVLAMKKEENLAWLPIRTSLYIEKVKELQARKQTFDATKDGGLDERSAAVVNLLRDELRGLGKQIQAVDKRISEIEDNIVDRTWWTSICLTNGAKNETRDKRNRE